ncbi:surface-adhesin E family protein [Allosphingosinicella sp.]|uniref:surface-adhesin E family protein n=1 Tax=Allosphingosinicella sp. TaxID=2823234 RepID=UPI0037845FF2
MIGGVLLAMAFQLLPAPALPRWRVVGRNPQAEYAVDPQSIQRQGTRVRAAVRLRFSHPQPGAPALGVMRYLYDCRANTIRSEASDIYDARGRFIGTLQSRADQLRDVPIGPTSPNAQVRNYLCMAGRR